PHKRPPSSPRSLPAPLLFAREQTHAPITPATARNIAGPSVGRKGGGLSAARLRFDLNRRKTRDFAKKVAPSGFRRRKLRPRRCAGSWRFPAPQSVAQASNPVQSGGQKISRVG